MLAFMYGFEVNPEIWGGVGILCAEFHPTDSTLLAALTLKTSQLEVWRVDCAQMVGIMNLEKRVTSLQWNPYNPN